MYGCTRRHLGTASYTNTIRICPIQIYFILIQSICFTALGSYQVTFGNHEIDFEKYTSCKIMFRGIGDPSMYRMRVSSHRLHITKRGISEKDFYLWFPIKMVPETADSVYDEKDRCIVVTVHASMIH